MMPHGARMLSVLDSGNIVQSVQSPVVIQVYAVVGKIRSSEAALLR